MPSQSPDANLLSPVEHSALAFSTELKQTPAGYLVAASGEIDLVGAPKLREVLMEAVDISSSEVISVDFQRVTFIDSMGISALVSAQNCARQAGKRIVLSEPPERVRKVLELVGLSDTFGLLGHPIETADFVPNDHTEKTI